MNRVEDVLKVEDIVKFKGDINQLIDEYIKNGTSTVDKNKHRILSSVIIYFNRMRNIYSSNQEDDDSDVMSDSNESTPSFIQAKKYLKV